MIRDDDRGQPMPMIGTVLIITTATIKVSKSQPAPCQPHHVPRSRQTR